MRHAGTGQRLHESTGRSIGERLELVVQRLVLLEVPAGSDGDGVFAVARHAVAHPDV
jgi:hypothetical protein